MSEYAIFNSQPRRTCDDLHFFYRDEEKHVFATTSDQMEEELDPMVYDKREWIVTLRSYTINKDVGLPVIREMPDIISTVYKSVFDEDCVSTYPWAEIVLNASKATTYMELSRVRGMDERTQRSVGINFTAPLVNNAEICYHIFKQPSPMEMLAHYQAYKEKKKAA